MNLASKAPKPQFMLSTETYNEIAEVLKSIEQSTMAQLAIFCEANGAPVNFVGRQGDIDLAVLSSLAAGNYAATREMAHMLHEGDSFKFLFLEGDHYNLYLCNVDFEYLLTIVFAKSVALGMVRIYANRAVKQLQQILQRAKLREEQIDDQIIDSEFSDLLGQAFDASFKK